MNKLLNMNPVFRRYLWTELSLSRLVIAPLILAGIYLLIYLISEEKGDFIENVQTWSLSIFSFVIFLWGTRLVSESVIGEHNNGTWDNQRMTLVGPWKTAIGILFGSTIYTWYLGIIAICIYFAAAFYLPDTEMRLRYGFIVLIAGVMVHAIALSLSILGLKKNQSRAKINSLPYFLMGILFAIFLNSFLGITLWEDGNLQIKWFFAKLTYGNIFLITIVVFTLWAILGLYRVVRRELQYENGPWVWVSFLVFLTLYCSGFIPNTNELSSLNTLLMGLYIGFIVCITWVYFMVLNEEKDIVGMRLLISNYRERNWKAFGVNVPLWLITFAITFMISCALIVVSFLASGAPGLMGSKEQVLSSNIRAVFTLYPLVIFLFVVRDVALVLWLNLGKNNKRADMAAIIYLILLYLLLPWIFSLAFDKESLSVFLPIPWVLDFVNYDFSPSGISTTFVKSLIYGFVPVLIQAGLMLYLVFRRFRAKNMELEQKLADSAGEIA